MKRVIFGKRVILGASGLALAATGALAGGIDRSGQGLGILWEKGEAVNLSFGFVTPSVTSAIPAAAGDVGMDYTQLSFAYKKPLNDRLAVALIYDQPWGAGIEYSGGPLTGTRAELQSSAVTGVLHYRTAGNFSLYGGLRMQSMAGQAAVPLVGYTLDAARDWSMGYLVGAAFERPEIALRVALTYNSAIDHTLEGTETSPFPGGPVTAFDNTTPQSLNLDFQTGVAEGTLVFGSVRWVDWSEYDVTPARYPLGALVDFEQDVITYTLGVGRKFTDRWSGALSFAYEAAEGTPQPNLSPKDGYKSVSLAAIYAVDEMTSIRAGVSYVDIGDTTSAAGIAFENSEALGVGISLTRRF